RDRCRRRRRRLPGSSRRARGAGAVTPLKTRILLADDHALVRRGLRLVLEAEPDMEVVAEAGDGAEAVRRTIDIPADLAILDISMPRMTGLQAATEIRRRKPELRCLMLSMHDNERSLYQALKAGASGLGGKGGPDCAPGDGVRGGMRGEAFLFPGAMTPLIE